MKKIIVIMALSSGSMLNVLALVFFMLFLFGIIGLHSLGDGVTYNRCRFTANPVNATYWPIDYNYKRLCNMGDRRGSCKLAE